jgi:hypothetical protein
VELNVGGWIFLVLSWAVILSVNVLCFLAVFREKKERIVDTQDLETLIDKEDR